MPEPFFATSASTNRTTGGVHTLRPYFYDGFWVFDEPTVGLTMEPFVGGVTEMIDRLAAGIPDAKSGFHMKFADSPFEGFQQSLTWLRTDPIEGKWYRAEVTGDEGWLCPALLLYLPQPPARIYLRADASPLPHDSNTP